MVGFVPGVVYRMDGWILTGVGLLDPSGMITSVVKLEDVVEKGFKALLEERDRHCKILVDMRRD